MVIDGQQRLITLTLILIALRASVKADSGINTDELNISFLINQFKSGETSVIKMRVNNLY